MKFQFLITDVLLWLLFGLVIVFAYYNFSQAHLRSKWQQVFKNPIGAATFVVLIVYCGIALLDSLHFYPQQQPAANNQNSATLQPIGMQTVLDIVLNNMQTRVEETYSAPFASHSFAKKTVVDETTSIARREFPPLKYAAAHLSSPAHKKQDIIQKSTAAIAVLLLLWLGGGYLLLLIIYSYQKFKNKAPSFKKLQKKLYFSRSASTAANYTTLAIVLVLGVLWYLSHYYHVFGTDKVGYDVFYISLKSVRTGVVIGTLTTLIMLPLALVLGLCAGFFGGVIDDIVQYIYTTINSIPSVLLIAAAVLVLDLYMHNNAEQFSSVITRADWRLFFICMILGMTSWTSLCRLIRAETIVLREMSYVDSARAFAQKKSLILIKHILPNTMHIVLITMVLDFSALVLAEAVLSYIGIGVDLSTHSWGNMINAARMEMAREPMVWWSLLASFSAMFILVLCANLFTDVVRASFDPRTSSKI